MMGFVWIVWKERNDRVFSNVSHSCAYFLNSILFFVDFWTGTLCLSLKRKMSAELLMRSGREYLLSKSDDLSFPVVHADGVRNELVVVNDECISQHPASTPDLRTYVRRRWRGAPIRTDLELSQMVGGSYDASVGGLCVGL